MGVVSVKSTHLRYRFSGEQKFPSCIAQEGKDAWREISRSIRSRIRGGFRLCLSCRKPPRLAFEAIAAFLDRSAAPPAQCRRGELKLDLVYFATKFKGSQLLEVSLGFPSGVSTGLASNSVMSFSSRVILLGSLP